MAVCLTGWLLIIGCRRESHVDLKATTGSFIGEITYDTLLLTMPELFSETGYFRIAHNKIYFFDPATTTVSSFNLQGAYLQQVLSRGNGPGEVPGFEKAAFTDSGQVVFFKNDYRLLLYSREFFQIRRVNIDFGDRQSVYTKTDARNPATYVISTNRSLYGNFWLATGTKSAFLPVEINGRINRELDWFANYPQHIKHGLTIARINLQSGQVDKVFGRHDKAYLAKPNIAHDFINLDLKGNRLFANQGIAEKISVYDLDGHLLYRFGVVGRDMNTDYEQTSTFNETAMRIRELNRKYGFYYHIYADRTSHYFFRSYSKGNSPIGGLQIYYDTTLIADAQVPVRFNVIGKTGNTYFADGIVDEENEILALFTFKISPDE